MPADRLLVVTPSLGGGGAERHLVRILPALASRLETHLAVLKSGGALEGHVPAAIPRHEIGCTTWPRASWRLRALVRRLDPGAVLGVQDAANVPLLMALRTLGTRQPPVAVCVQNTLSSVLAHARPRTRWRLRTAVRRLYPKADAVIAVSEGVRRDLEAVCPNVSARLRVIFNAAVDPDTGTLAAEPCDHPFFREPTTPVLVACGRLTAQKDYPTLLAALCRVRDTHPARLIVLGEGPLERELKIEAQRIGVANAVDFAGFVANPLKYFSRATAFVMSSRWEGLPTVLAEALACGVPVVSTDCPSGPREILDGGRYGRLVPVADAGALAHALSELIEDDAARRALSAGGPARADLFSAQRSGQSYAALMTSLSASRARSR